MKLLHRDLISFGKHCLWPLLDSLLSLFCRFVKTLGLNLFGGDSHQAAFRILTDFRKGKFGYVSLERPPL